MDLVGRVVLNRLLDLEDVGPAADRVVGGEGVGPEDDGEAREVVDGRYPGMLGRIGIPATTTAACFFTTCVSNT